MNTPQRVPMRGYGWYIAAVIVVSLGLTMLGVV